MIQVGYACSWLVKAQVAGTTTEDEVGPDSTKLRNDKVVTSMDLKYSVNVEAIVYLLTETWKPRDDRIGQ